MIGRAESKDQVTLCGRRSMNLISNERLFSAKYEPKTLAKHSSGIYVSHDFSFGTDIHIK